MSTNIVKKISIIITIILLLSSMVVFISCDKKETTFEAKLSKEIQANLYIRGGDDQFDSILYVVKEFNKIYKNVNIVYRKTYNYEELALEQLLSNNREIDLFFINENMYDNKTIVTENTENLDEIISLVGLNKNIKEKRNGHDEIYGVPMAFNVKGIVVNTDLLKKYNCSIPTNISELKNVCNILVENNITPIQGVDGELYSNLFGTQYLYKLYNNKYSYSVSEVNSEKEGYKSTFDNILNLEKEFINLGYTSKDKMYDSLDEAKEAFMKGEIPFLVVDTETYSQLIEGERHYWIDANNDYDTSKSFAYEFIPLPTDEKTSVSYLETWYYLAVNKNSENLEVANEFIRFLSSAESLDLLAEKMGVPTVSSHVNSDYKFNSLFNSSLLYESNILLNTNIKNAQVEYLETYVKS